MTFSLAIFLYIYYAFLMIWLFFCLVAVYHLLKFGFKNAITFFTLIIFILVMAAMLYGSSYFINQIDWTEEITVLGDVFSKNID